MEKCNAFEKFSAVLSPELAVLNLSAEQQRLLITGLYKLASEAFEHERNRQTVIEQLKQLGPKLKKFGQLATAMNNCEKGIDKALAICTELELPGGPSDFELLLDETKSTLHQAYQYMERTRHYILGFEIPLGLPKKLDKMGQEKRFESIDELTKEWKEEGEGLGFLEWLDTIEGFGLQLIYDFNDLLHFRTRAADHWFMVQADAFLRKNKVKSLPLRRKIIVTLFLAAFDDHVQEAKVKTLLERRAERAAQIRDQK